jgi:hypothetical protein
VATHSDRETTDAETGTESSEFLIRGRVNTLLVAQ